MAEISNESDYKNAMRVMIRRVQSGEAIDTFSESVEDMEILSDCIRLGYINGAVEQDGRPFRTLDGKMHPVIHNSHIPLKGIAFLHPQPDWKFLIPTLISLAAFVKSFFFD